MNELKFPTILVGEQGLDREIALLETRFMDLSPVLIKSKLIEKEGDTAYRNLEFMRAVICYYNSIQMNATNFRAHAKLMRVFSILKDEENLNKAVAFFENYIDSVQDSSALLIVAETFADHGRTEIVTKILNRLVEDVENNATHWLNIGRIAHSIGEMNIAAMAYEEAFGIDSQDPLVVSNLVYFHLLNGDERRGEDILRNRLVLDPRELLYWELLDVLLRGKDALGPFIPKYAPFENVFNVFSGVEKTSLRLARAKSILLEDPDNVVALFVAGESYMDLKDYAKAEIHYRRLLELDPLNHLLGSRVRILESICESV